MVCQDCIPQFGMNGYLASSLVITSLPPLRDRLSACRPGTTLYRSDALGECRFEGNRMYDDVMTDGALEHTPA